MFKKIFSPDPFKIFYLVFAYILAFSIWWAYLLYEKNETAYKEKIALNQITFWQIHPGDEYSQSSDYKIITAKYQRQRLMIETEGSAFIVLLLLGLLLVRRVFMREMQLVRQQHNFLLSVTHELKSPLSTVKLSLQTMAVRTLEPEQESKLIANSLVDIDRLESLVDNILFAAKIERDEPGFSNDEINLSDISQLVIERFVHNKKDIRIQNQIAPGVYLHADPIGYTSLVMNLVENAIKYSEPSTEVIVSLIDSSDKVILSVADQGIGIADNEKGRVFNKFYRIGNEDTRKTKGTGLGLYIVKRLVEIYNGEISITDNKPVGSVFKIVLPKVK